MVDAKVLSPGLIIEPVDFSSEVAEAITTICCNVGGVVVVTCLLPESAQPVLTDLRRLFEPVRIEVVHTAKVARGEVFDVLTFRRRGL